jgi:hypothetical protein
LEKIKDRSDVDNIDLNFSAFVGEDIIASSYTIDEKLVKVAAGLGMSVTLSVYKSEREESKQEAKCPSGDFASRVNRLARAAA